MKKMLLFFIIGANLGFSMTPDAALEKLKTGNRRFVDNRTIHSSHEKRRLSTKKGQSPFAVILGCADSRVAPEIIFDQGIGDLFVVRVAGNVVDPVVLESIDFAVAALESVVIVVLGHANCGAVDATFTGNDRLIPEIAQRIEPAIQHAENLEDAIKMNAQYVAQELERRQLLKERIRSGKLEVVGGYYDFRTGKVQFLK